MENNNLAQIIDFYKNIKDVESIAIGGSTSANSADNSSDLDLYVFVSKPISIDMRYEFVEKVSSNFEVGCEYFGSGDEYFVDKINKQMDVMYWDKGWFESVVYNVWEKFYPSNGYTTCFLFTLSNFKIIYDKNNWLLNLQNKVHTTYPEQLKTNIIKRNMMLLKDKPFASYYEQISKAINRNDIVSVNHRIAGFLASYFDIIFAKNELLHPGEKRLIPFAKNNCKILPKDFENNIQNLLKQPNSDTLYILDEMVKNLRDIL